MDWRLKCLAFHLLRWAPRSTYAFLQRRVTGRYFTSVNDAVLAAYSFHVQNYLSLERSGTVLEFGSGTSLLTALLLSRAGATVLAYDIERMATVEQVNHVIRQLRVHGGEWPEIKNLNESLEQLYRIRYCAPADARETGLSPGSVDFICSNSTLEHIPRADIGAILAEARRIASPGALLSFVVDYHDHYSSTDPAISRFNFYRYPDWLWRLFNPPAHYQNRLRHGDYLRLFCDFEVISARATPAGEPWCGRVCERFRHYSREDLRALNGHFCLRVRG